MSRTIDLAIAHWKRVRGERKSIAVPEWGTEERPLLVYWKPWTLAEQDAILETSGNFRPASFARILAVKAENEDGRHLFADADHTEMLNEVDPQVIKRIAATILADLDRVHAEIESGDTAKN